MKPTGKIPDKAWPALLMIFLALGFSHISQAQTAGDQILSETNRLEKVLASLKLSAEDKGLRAAAIVSVRQNVQSGKLYLSLYRLQNLGVEIMAQDYAASKASIESKGMDAFEKEWQGLGLELDEKEKRLAGMRADKSPAAIFALSESALTQVRPYYQSGRLYGLNTTIRDGLYYMGLAPANLEFAVFCRELNFPQNGKPLKFRSLSLELAKLEAEILEGYRRIGAGDNQPQFNRLNSTLKMAVELDKEGRYAGALLKYLETTLFLNLLTAPPSDADDLSRLIEQSRALESRLKKTGDVDNSIALIYFELAQAALDEASRGRLDPGGFRRAAVIIGRVLPGYFELMSGDK